MNNTEESQKDFSAPDMVEGIAHVVAVEGTVAWLEPEQTTSCGSCASSSACGAKGGIGTTANRLEARRFSFENHAGLVVGERVVVGIRENALLKASLTAYAIPLAAMLGTGAMAQWAAGSDGITMSAMVAGLVLGLVISRLTAGYLSSRGDLAPRFMRRANTGVACQITQEAEA